MDRQTNCSVDEGERKDLSVTHGSKGTKKGCHGKKADDPESYDPKERPPGPSIHLSTAEGSKATN